MTVKGKVLWILAAVVVVLLVLGGIWFRHASPPELAPDDSDRLPPKDIEDLRQKCQAFAVKLKTVDTEVLIRGFNDDVKHPNDLKEIYASICRNCCIEAELALRGTNAIPALRRNLGNKEFVATGLSTPCASVGQICQFRLENVTNPQVLYLTLLSPSILDAVIQKQVDEGKR